MIRGRSTFLANVNELASVHALSGNEGLLVGLVFVRVAEDDAGKGRTTARVVNDLLDEAAQVA